MSTIHPNRGSMLQWRRWGFEWLSAVYIALTYGLPTALCLWLFRQTRYPIVVALGVPLLWTFSFLFIAGLLSLPHRFAVTAGKFFRDLNEPAYFHRRLHGLCWTMIYYNKPAYFVCLSIPFLKRMTFRLFGYRGSMNFTVYPDTWIRDLPLLQFEDGVYVSNRATLGTNIVLSNGCLLVDRITLKQKVLIGHLAILGPGVFADVGSEVGIGAVIGIRSKLGPGSYIGGHSDIDNIVRVGRDVVVGPKSYVGPGAVLADGLKLPRGSVIPPRTKPSTFAHAGSVVNAEDQSLSCHEDLAEHFLPPTVEAVDD